MLTEPKRNNPLAKCSTKYHGKAREYAKLGIWNTKRTQDQPFSFSKSQKCPSPTDCLKTKGQTARESVEYSIDF